MNFQNVPNQRYSAFAGIPSVPSSLGFPRISVGKESVCSAGALGPIPELDNPLEKEMTTHSGILAWRIPIDRGAWQATVLRVTRVRHDLATKPQPFQLWIDVNVRVCPPIELNLTCLLHPPRNVLESLRLSLIHLPQANIKFVF